MWTVQIWNTCDKNTLLVMVDTCTIDFIHYSSVWKTNTALSWTLLTRAPHISCFLFTWILVWHSARALAFILAKNPARAHGTCSCNSTLALCWSLLYQTEIQPQNIVKWVSSWQELPFPVFQYIYLGTAVLTLPEYLKAIIMWLLWNFTWLLQNCHSGISAN